MIWVLCWTFQRILKGEVQLPKTQYVDAATNTTITVTFTSFTNAIAITPTKTSIATTCKAKRVIIETSGSIWIYGLLKWFIGNVIAMVNCIKLKLLWLDKRVAQITKRQYVNATAATCTSPIALYATTSTTNASTHTVTAITTMPKDRKVKFSGKL